MATWEKASQRTVKCPRCKERRFYIFTDGQRQEYRDATNGDVHNTSTCASYTPGDKVAAKAATKVEPIRSTMLTDEWKSTLTADMSALIPSKDQAERYIPRKLDGKTDVETLIALYHANAEAVSKGQRPINVLLISDTGAGKNHLVRAVASKLSVPYLRVALNGGVTVDGLVGKYTLPEAGRTEWQDGRLSSVCRTGGIVCLDEINACPAEIAFVLHPALDDERTLMLDDRPEALRISPNVFFVGTMNPDYRGTKPLNEAFRNRFDVTLYFDYEPAIEKKLIPNPKLLKLAGQLRQSYRNGSGDISNPVSTRSLMAYERTSALVGPDIARDAFVWSFPRDEQQAVREAFSLHMDSGEPIDVDKDVNLDA